MPTLNKFPLGFHPESPALEGALLYLYLSLYGLGMSYLEKRAVPVTL